MNTDYFLKFYFFLDSILLIIGLEIYNSFENQCIFINFNSTSEPLHYYRINFPVDPMQRLKFWFRV